MLELFEYLVALGYKAELTANGVTISIGACEVLCLIRGINFRNNCPVEAVLISSLKYELRVK